MPNSVSSATLARYFSATATAEERASVEAWIGNDPARRAAVAEWQAAWDADLGHLGAAYDAETAWARVSGRVGLLTLVRNERAPRRVLLAPLTHHAARRARAGRWAAAAAVVLLAGATAWRAFGPFQRPPVVATSAARVYTTAPGQRSILRLPDGTEVMLNVASRLTVPATFGRSGQPRALELEGQASFAVVHDAKRPFTVRTARGITRDIGTRFDIRAYRDDGVERIAVTEGEVAVRGDSAASEVSLRRGQIAKITDAGVVTLTRDDEIDQVSSWTEGRLLLDDVSLAEAVRLIGRWYDLDVQVGDSLLAQRRVVGGSYRDESVAQVLEIVAAAVGARYERHGQSVTFFPRDGR